MTTQELEQIANQLEEPKQKQERLTIRIPPQLNEQINDRVSELGYMNTSEYVRGLVHRDIEQQSERER